MGDERAGVLSRPGVAGAVNVLRAGHRRRLLRGVSAGRIGDETDAMTRGRADEAESELRRTHLPMLEAEGYIEWDRETGEISRGPRFDEIEPFLELIEEHEDELPPFWP